MERAETLRGVKFSCDPRPLEIDELPKFLALMQAHALIEYNGERWFRVHPLVAEHVRPLPKP